MARGCLVLAVGRLRVHVLAKIEIQPLHILAPQLLARISHTPLRDETVKGGSSETNQQIIRNQAADRTRVRLRPSDFATIRHFTGPRRLLPEPAVWGKAHMKAMARFVPGPCM